MKEEIRKILLEGGACAVGFAKAAEVDPGEWELFEEWLSRGRHAGMEYMRNHPQIRRDPRLLLEGANSIISIAFNYRGDTAPNSPVASYALGDDYHDVLRDLLNRCLNSFPTDAGYRICIDSAPILERYWARKAGVGFIGDNGALIVPGAGSMGLKGHPKGAFSGGEIQRLGSAPISANLNENYTKSEYFRRFIK